ncbi:MAG: glycoside hydrolase family 15 protein [Chloroflexi bacterium]|jgi:GH15 family glucan-1,4-alpha-glucosidase|nr:glycoside hydrolase family 15 protein [Chloroflexota bacterium]MBT7080605.1 glycoside hydrolase family 15 protein [Chloroflexota bacterium]
MPYKPIGDYGLIGNMHSCALVGNDGSINWCCLPRFDSPSIFAAILDDNKGGRFSIKPRGKFTIDQAYIPDTNVLKTTFDNDSGSIELIDFMPLYKVGGGRLSRLHQIMRIVICTRGVVTFNVLFEPRMDYARGDTNIRCFKHGVVASHSDEKVVLASDVPFEIDGGRASGQHVIKSGQRVNIMLVHGSSRPMQTRFYKPEEKLTRTVDYWRGKVAKLNIESPWHENIMRSYLALHLLVYSPTGAIIAAPTTSLPEEIGGQRNWDYRYAWLRDASLTLDAFSHLGHRDEGAAFMGWLLSVCDKCGGKAQILYDIDFNDPLDEKTLNHLSGYRDSRPVRIGNGAYTQLQLDVFGEVLEAAHNYVQIGGYVSHKTWRLLESFVDAACTMWHLPDSGIWEVRGGPFHFTHSKMMCWVAANRGIKIAKQLGYKNRVHEWEENEQEIREDILKRGWNESKQAFTQHYDTQALDASILLMPLLGFLPVSDERVKSTVDCVMRELIVNGLVRRYNTSETDDGLAGSEGAFLWCSFWLVRVLLKLDRFDEAKALYERLIGYSNHLGLLSEMVDPASGQMLGNFPQALSHLGIITAGLELTRIGSERALGGDR